MVVNSLLIRPYFLGGGIGGVPLDSHELWRKKQNMFFLKKKNMVNFFGGQGFIFQDVNHFRQRFYLHNKRKRKLFLQRAEVKSVTAVVNMGVSKNNGTPKSSILIEVSIINHPFWGTPIFGNTHIVVLFGSHSNAGIYGLLKPCKQTQLTQSNHRVGPWQF